MTVAVVRLDPVPLPDAPPGILRTSLSSPKWQYKWAKNCSRKHQADDSSVEKKDIISKTWQMIAFGDLQSCQFFTQISEGRCISHLHALVVRYTFPNN